jgi:hypothetical protein
MRDRSKGLPVVVRDTSQGLGGDASFVDLFQLRVEALQRAIAKAWLEHMVKTEQKSAPEQGLPERDLLGGGDDIDPD